MLYRLRFFFDPGSGVCFWAANDDAREHFGYPVRLNDLPLPEEIRRAGEVLIERFDTSVDMSDPGGSSLWSEGEADLFNEAASDWLRAASGELGRHFEIVDEHASPRSI